MKAVLSAPTVNGDGPPMIPVIFATTNWNAALSVTTVCMVISLSVTSFAIWVYWILTFPCPRCESRLWRSQITRMEIRCDNCSWRITATAAKRRDSEKKPDAPNHIRLWDGQLYDRGRLAKSYPELVLYRKSHEVLVEEASTIAGWWDMTWRMTVLFCIFGNLSAGIVVFYAGLHSGWSTAFLNLFLAQIPIALFSLLIAAIGSARPRDLRGRIEVQPGQLTIRRGMTVNHFPLSDCEWHVGRLEGLWAPRVVLIACPQTEFAPETEIAVGFKDGARKMWCDFLTVAALPHRSFIERPVPLPILCRIFLLARWSYQSLWRHASRCHM